MENAHAKINGTEMHFSMRIYCAKAFSRASHGLGLPVFYQAKAESVRLQLKFSIRNEVSFHIASAFQLCECVFFSAPGKSTLRYEFMLYKVHNL